MTARRLWIFLIVSLTANLFLGGLFAGKLIFDRKPAKHGPRLRVDLRHATEVLKPAERETATKLWRLRQPELRVRLRASREARRNLRRILEAEGSSQKQIEEAFAEVSKRGRDVQSSFQTVLRDIAYALPADQRKAFFRAVFRRHGKRSRRGSR